MDPLTKCNCLVFASFLTCFVAGFSYHANLKITIWLAAVAIGLAVCTWHSLPGPVFVDFVIVIALAVAWCLGVGSGIALYRIDEVDSFLR
jgi:hypothetical protein